MSINIILILLTTFFWSISSVWWYTCNIKNTCRYTNNSQLFNLTHTIKPKHPLQPLVYSKTTKNHLDTIESGYRFNALYQESLSTIKPMPIPSTSSRMMSQTTSIQSPTDVLRRQIAKNKEKKPAKRIILFQVKIASFKNTKDNQAYLNHLTDWLIKDLNHRVNIIGHTDNDNEKDNNSLLGLIRANKIKQTLIRLGAYPHSIHIESKGDTSPIASNRSELGKKQNRRVEIIPQII